MPLNSDLCEFVALLNSKKVEYLVVGAFAVAFHGVARFTADLDLFLNPSPENAARAVRAIDEFGLASLRITPADISAPDQIIQIGVKPNRLDLLTSLSGVSFEQAWESRVAGEIDGIPTHYIGREELIRNKQATGRPGDLWDVEALRKRGT